MAAMKTETLVHHHPPTPPIGASELQYDLHHIAQHNFDHENHYFSRHGSAYGSPTPMMDSQLPQFHSQHIKTEQFSDTQADLGLGIQYEGYGPGPTFYDHDGQYNSMHSQVIGAGTPPTPASADDGSDTGIQTRSGRTIAASGAGGAGGGGGDGNRPRPKLMPKTRKPKANKADKPKTPKLTQPLSILTKAFTDIPVKNMEAWVNRPPETRHKEAERRNGYVTRPMNSFMLYRSAYADRTKQWCLQNNHQVVSSVSGESWPMEPAEIRELYNEYAKIERINHQNAHPTYKFSPSKAATPARRRKGEYSEEDDEPSDFDDSEWDPGHRRSKTRPSRRHERSTGYPTPNHFNDSLFEQPFGPNAGMNKSAWDYTNEGRPMPLPMGQADLYHQYYQTSVHPHMSANGIEDIRMRRMDTPVGSMPFSHGHALLGLPGGQSVDLMQLHSHAGTSLDDGSQVDPMLLAFDDGHGGHVNGAEASMAHHADYRNGHMGMMERDLDQESVHSLLANNGPADDYHQEQWHADLTIAPMEQGSEFDKWMDDGWK